MNWSKIIFGTILLIFCGFWLYGNQDLLNIERNGIVVKMRIVEKPEDCITVNSHTQNYMNVSYKGKYYGHVMTSSDCGWYRVGDSIEMRYLEGSKEILYPGQHISMGYYTVLACSLLSLALVVYGIFSKPKQG